MTSSGPTKPSQLSRDVLDPGPRASADRGGAWTARWACASARPRARTSLHRVREQGRPRHRPGPRPTSDRRRSGDEAFETSGSGEGRSRAHSACVAGGHSDRRRSFSSMLRYRMQRGNTPIPASRSRAGTPFPRRDGFRVRGRPVSPRRRRARVGQMRRSRCPNARKLKCSEMNRFGARRLEQTSPTCGNLRLCRRVPDAAPTSGVRR